MNVLAKGAALVVMSIPVVLAGCAATLEDPAADGSATQAEEMSAKNPTVTLTNVPPVYTAPSYPAPVYRAPTYVAPMYSSPVYLAPVYVAPVPSAPPTKAPAFVIGPPHT